jgi:hypothetical protein
MPKPYPTQTLAEIRLARQRCPSFDPRLPTSSAARFAKITPRQLRDRHRSLATKSAHRRLQWRWSCIEQILAGNHGR